MHLYDTNLKPDRAHVGIGEGEWPGDIFTIVVCDGGTLLLAPTEPLEIWRDGVMTPGLEMPDLPTYEPFNHRHAWVDAVLGRDNEYHWTPFPIGIRGSEAGLLAVKAARYPGQNLWWDRDSLTFTNHSRANASIGRRDYRPGFEPVRL